MFLLVVVVVVVLFSLHHKMITCAGRLIKIGYCLISMGVL
jgi:hypothetical protein